jgi:cytidylate kinase
LPPNTIILTRKINIAIDGHSTCGKGTLAKHLAKKLGYVFIDSGAMYRAVAYYLLSNKIELEEIQSNPDTLNTIQISFRYNEENDFFETYLNGTTIENEIRTAGIANYVGKVSSLKEVRDFLINQQQKFGKEKGVVMDGRDIGTAVLPDAELKIFMTTDPLIRARRKFDELGQKNMLMSYDEVVEMIKKRDLMEDAGTSPLVKADDAIILDNTNMSREEQARVALTWAKGVIAVS